MSSRTALLGSSVILLVRQSAIKITRCCLKLESHDDTLSTLAIIHPDMLSWPLFISLSFVCSLPLHLFHVYLCCQCLRWQVGLRISSGLHSITAMSVSCCDILSDSFIFHFHSITLLCTCWIRDSDEGGQFHVAASSLQLVVTICV